MSLKNTGKLVVALTLALVVAISVIGVFASAPIVVKAQEKGPASDVVIFKRVPLEQAVQALKSGDIDYYDFALRAEQVDAVKADPDLDYITAPAGIVDFMFNPAPKKDGFNPFTLREVRFAMNYLIDRDYVVTSVYKGLASPMYCHLSAYDPDYTVVFDVIAKYEFKYDPKKASEIVTEALTKAGATKGADGLWYFNGKPIEINFIIRIEDERKVLGDLLASELEKLGFKVNRLYMTFRQAIPIVYGTDPAEHQWDIYTEGWGKSAPDKYDYGTVNQFYAPWYGWLPGYQESGWWQYTNSSLDEVGKKIFNGKFKSKAERDELYRAATEMGIQESVRVFIATTLDAYGFRKEIRGITLDLGTGLRSPFNLREIYKPGEKELKVGHLWVWTEGTAWNPVAGFEDVYSVDIWRGVYDAWIWRHPHNGLPIPFRVKYSVETAGPEGTLSVPPDAVLWNATTDAWVPVGEGVTAVSKVTFDLSTLIGAKWHDGNTITWADVLYAIAQNYEIAFDPDKSAIESGTAATLKEILAIFKGFKFLIDDKKLEVYIDYWHFDDNYIAEMAVLTSVPNPWQLLYATDKLVFEEKKVAYSDSAAGTFNVPWLSLVLKDHADMVKEEASKLLDAKDIPYQYFTLPGGVTLLTEDEALKRYQDLVNWIDEYGHAEISDGSFMVYKYDPQAQYCELHAFRDESYPFSPGDWYFGFPEAVEIVNVGTPTIVKGQPARVYVDVKGPAPIFVKYLLRDPLTGEVLSIGMGKPTVAGRFMVEIPSDVTVGLREGDLYEVIIVAYSDVSALISTQRKFLEVFRASAVIEPALKQIGEVSKSVSELSESVRSQIGAISEEVSAVTSELESLAKTVSGLQEALPKILSTVSSGFENLGSSIKDLGTTMTDSITKISDTLTSSLEGMSTSIQDTLSKATSKLATKDDIGEISSGIDDLKSTEESLASAIGTLTSILYVLVVLIIINIIIAGLSLRRR